MSTIENTPEEWDEEYDEAAIDAQKATAEIRESQDVIGRLGMGRGGLSQKDVDYLGLSWWRHTDGIEASLAMLGGGATGADEYHASGARLERVGVGRGTDGERPGALPGTLLGPGGPRADG